ncbi:HNH endonuclease [Rhodobacterales bacterium HKCCE4037]|nr:HNH endonuclease [Rhodobacterales bacterium HKCCE4037]
MGRLKGRALPSRLARAAPAVARVVAEVKRDRDRAAHQPWRKWYGTQRWRKLSEEVRREAGYACARQGCGRVDGRPGQMVADHIVPHRGDEAKFWDRANLQCLCKPCHDAAKQAEEAAHR